MERINFELLKNNKSYISKKNIKCINNDKLTFIIDGEKYKFYKDILEKETKEDKIVLDFKHAECRIFIKGYKNNLIININVIENKKIDNIIQIKYMIETEENIINEIKIEYI